MEQKSVPIDPFDATIFPCPTSQWVPNSKQNICWSCKNEFSGGIFKSGKHHCRKCANVICKKCGENKISGHRVCKICYQLLYKNNDSQVYVDIDEEKNNIDTFKISIGVDFGTDGLGVAYAIKGDDQVYVHDKWRSKHYGTIEKPKTIILFDDEQNITAMGIDAKHSYISLANSQQTEWMLFERFKMSLYEPSKDDISCIEEEKSDVSNNDNVFKQVSISDELISVNGLRYSSEKVFIAVFKHIYKISTKYLKKQKIIDIKTVKSHEIQWIITVPAIWNYEAKHKMEDWVIKAGLAYKNIPNQCLVVYEPDCASLAVQYHFKKNNNIHYDNDKKKSKRKQVKEQNNDNTAENKYEEKTTPFEVGDKYILVDAGGGTVDVACHQVIGEFEIKEIVRPTGGACGSCYIDDQYIKLLAQIFSDNNKSEDNKITIIEEFKNKNPNIYVKIIHNFQQAKKKFYSNPNNERYSVELPFKLLQFLEERISEKIKASSMFNNVRPDSYIEHWVKNAKVNGTSNLVSLDGEMLCMDTEHIWKSFLFDYVVTPITNHIEKLLNKPQLKAQCKYLCLVGGLSCSPYFQLKIKQHFGVSSENKLRIIIPRKPILSVVEGAALFGVTKDFVQARVLKCHYGIVVGCRKHDAVANNIASEYIKKHQYKDKIRNQWYVPGCVHILGAKEEEIRIHQKKITTAQRPNPNKPCVLKIFASDGLNKPKTMDDGSIIGMLQIEFEDQDEDNLQVTVEFNFSGTMIQVHAYPTNTPENKKLFGFTYKHY